uniref:Protein kinase domain-containing protein n=1 Tax=Eutreptiella gymnastica TaxID=73025 RepID=A0A7S1N6Y3_9EUGL
MDPNGRCKISDFGTATLLSQAVGQVEKLRWLDLITTSGIGDTVLALNTSATIIQSAVDGKGPVALGTGTLNIDPALSLDEGLRGPAVAGTVVYMAPEAFSGEFSSAVDVYALGLTIVHAMTNVIPWSHLGISHLYGLVFHLCEFKPQHPIPEDAPSCLADLIADCIHPTATNRATVLDLMASEFLSVIPDNPSCRLHSVSVMNLTDFGRDANGKGEVDEWLDIPMIEG